VLIIGVSNRVQIIKFNIVIHSYMEILLQFTIADQGGRRGRMIFYASNANFPNLNKKRAKTCYKITNTLPVNTVNTMIFSPPPPLTKSTPPPLLLVTNLESATEFMSHSAITLITCCA